MNVIICLAKFFAHELNVVLPREVYRRRKCSFFWLEQNIIQIADLLARIPYQIIMDGIQFPLTAPKIIPAQSQISPQPSEFKVLTSPEEKHITPHQYDEFKVFYEDFDNPLSF